MKKILIGIILMLAPLTAAFAQDVVGKWKLDDGSAIVEVYKQGNAYNGSIYDPGNGKTYNCSMKVEGDVLHVRGSLDKKGLLGRTMDWHRVK